MLDRRWPWPCCCCGGSRQSLAGKQSRVGGDPGEKEGIRSRVVDRIDQLSLYQATPKTLLQLFQREAAASDDLFLGSFMAMSRRWRRKSTADHVAKGDRKRVSVRGAVNQKRAIDRLGNRFLGLRRGALFMPLDWVGELASSQSGHGTSHSSGTRVPR